VHKEEILEEIKIK